MNVLFVRVRNAGRSQMAEALFRQAAGGEHEARSAGSSPAARVQVVEAMRELGVDLAGRTSRRLEQAGMSLAETRAIRDEIAAGIERLLAELHQEVPR